MLAVAAINDHKTAHKHISFAPFQAYHNKKSVKLQKPPDQGLCLTVHPYSYQLSL